MKSVCVGLFIFLLSGSLQSFGQQVSVSGNEDNLSGKISVAGTGGKVCATIESFTDQIYLARGKSQNSAMALSRNLCIQDSDDIFCKPYRCEDDRSSRNSSLEILFDLSQQGSTVKIDLLSGDAAYECVSENSHSGFAYIASAPTILEASVLATNECLRAGGSLFCTEIDDVICNQIAGVDADAEIDIDEAIDFFNGLFN